MKTLPFVIKITSLLVFFTFAIYLGLETPNNETLRDTITRFGYVGIFVASVVSGFNIVVPIPIIAFAPAFVSGGLNFFLVILVISFGLTVGDLIGFLIGDIGKDISRGREKNIKLIQILKTLKERYRFSPYLLMFLYAAFVPLPNEVLVIPFAFLGYKLKYLFPAFLLGNIIFNLLFGYAGVTVFEFL